MPELEVQAVIFDMDGVLIDSGEVYGRHWERWAASHGIDVGQVRRVHAGRPPEDTIRLVAPGLDARTEAERFDATLAADRTIDQITLLPGVISLLATLPTGRWTIGTSARRAIALEWLQHLGLPIPAQIVTVDDVQHGKPAPDPYLQAAYVLGQDPRQCLVIEDAPAGIAAAKAAGAYCLALRTTHADSDLAAADALTDDLADVSVAFGSGALVVSW